MQEEINEQEKQDQGFLKRRLVVGNLGEKGKLAFQNLQTKNLPSFIKGEQDLQKKVKLARINSDYFARKVDKMEQALMKNKNARKYITKINNSEIVRDVKGIKINIIDAGG